jgi:hypothetical protein
MPDYMSDYDYEAPGTVPLIQQEGTTCWAAAAAMMLSWNNSQTIYTPDAIAMTGSPYTDYYARLKGLPADETPWFAAAAGMTCEPIRSYCPWELCDIMCHNQSPLMMCVYWPNYYRMTHFYVVTRVSGSGGNAWNALIEYNDPLTGTHVEEGYIDFYQKFEAAGDFPTLKVQLLHY